MKHLLPMLLLLTTVVPAVAERPKAVGVINYYAKYSARTTERTEKNTKAVSDFFERVKAVDDRAEWVDVDIFLPDRKEERDKWQRLIIAYPTDYFTLKMYEGMLDYIRSGGLLITQISGVLVDANENYEHDEGTTSSFALENFVGVHGASGCIIDQVKVVEQSPLTEGISTDDWQTLDPPVGSRCTTNQKAKVLMISKQQCKGPEQQGPYLSVMSVSKGACVYVAGALNSMQCAVQGQVMKNCLSPQTLEKYCIQE